MTTREPSRRTMTTQCLLSGVTREGRSCEWRRRDWTVVENYSSFPHLTFCLRAGGQLGHLGTLRVSCSLRCVRRGWFSAQSCNRGSFLEWVCVLSKSKSLGRRGSHGRDSVNRNRDLTELKDGGQHEKGRTDQGWEGSPLGLGAEFPESRTS